MDNLKIGILGANGFIGSALAKKLSLNNEIELHLFSRSFTTEIVNNIRYHKFDVLKNQESLLKELYELDLIYYLISENIPASSWNDAGLEIQNNLLPFVSLIEKLSTGKLKKVIFSSSAGTIYGTSSEKLDENSITNPFSPHGITKLTCEKYLNYFHHKNGLNFEIYRISNVYGPGQNTSKGLGIINTILENHLNSKHTNIFGDGQTVRNFIYIDDVVNALEKAIYNNLNKSYTLNLASSDNVCINDIISMIEEVINSKLKINYHSKRESDNPKISIDNTKLLETYNDVQFINLKEGILKTYNYIFLNFKNNN